ncbi:MAG: hypothetical protein OQL05_10895 [Gammaproteobacteria bacterium]|nr:hypothetical protein [Gammaproteobacteria bacterium]MCW8993039.1 hypothetical protein [Gammaproteobacteria bacterium]
MKRNDQTVVTGKYQRGAATLLISIVVLTTITFITLYTSRAVMTEQKISGNELRSRIAFEAAEAAAEMAIAYISDGRDRDEDGLLPGVIAGSDDDEFLFDSNGDGTRDSNTLELSNGSRATVSLLNADFGDIFATDIISQGWSDDRTATRTITQRVALVPALPNAPDNPLITRGTVVVNGSAEVVNPEGNSTIWSGGDVDLGSNNATHTEVVNPADVNYPDCLGDSANPCDTVQASDRYVAGLDIIEYDSSLNNLSDDDFFSNFFGLPPTRYRETRVTMDIDLAAGDNPDQIHLATDEVIWVDGNLSLNGSTMGCEVAVTGSNVCPSGNQDPSILIVNGDLNLAGGPQFYGMVYVMGDVNINGNANVVGSMVTQGNATNTTGNLTVIYNSALLRELGENGEQAGGGGGSWRDF